MARTIARALAAVACLGWLALPVAGQITIRVADASGAPIPAVRVAQHLGYPTRIVQAEDIPASGVIRLEPVLRDG